MNTYQGQVGKIISARTERGIAQQDSAIRNPDSAIGFGYAAPLGEDAHRLHPPCDSCDRNPETGTAGKKNQKNFDALSTGGAGGYNR